jgi:hypothetical protein
LAAIGAGIEVFEEDLSVAPAKLQQRAFYGQIQRTFLPRL